MSRLTRLAALPPTASPGLRVHPKRRLLADVSESFLADCGARNLSLRTIEQYEWSIRRFAQSIEAEASLADLEPVAVRAWIGRLKATRSSTSVRSATRALKVFSRWTADEGYVRADPLASVRLPQAPRPLIQPLDRSQVAVLMSTGSAVLRVAVAILADTGLRASELCGLIVEDVREGFLFVSGKGGYERLAPYGDGLHPAASDRAALESYLSALPGTDAQRQTKARCALRAVLREIDVDRAARVAGLGSTSFWKKEARSAGIIRLGSR